MRKLFLVLLFLSSAALAAVNDAQSIDGAQRNKLQDTVNALTGTTASFTASGLLSGQGLKENAITTTNLNYTVLSTDYTVNDNAVNNVITNTLPSAASSVGQMLLFKKTDLTGHLVVIAGNGSDTIDGAATKPLTLPKAFSILHCDTSSTWNTYREIDSQPSTEIYIVDNFFSATGDSSFTSVASGGTSGTADAGNAHPGVTEFDSVSANTDRAVLRKALQSMLFGGSANFAQWVVQVPTLSNSTDEYVDFIGWSDGTSNDAVDGVYFEYDRATAGSSVWTIATSKNSTRTKTVTSTAVTAGAWVVLGIDVNAAGTLANFYVNNVLVGSITTNIPTAAGRNTCACAGFRKTAGTAAVACLLVDQWIYRATLTTPLW